MLEELLPSYTDVHDPSLFVSARLSGSPITREGVKYGRLPR